MRQWLFEIRQRLGLTMLEAATKSGISESYYSMIENGHRNVSVPTAKKIGKALEFDWTKFYEDN